MGLFRGQRDGLLRRWAYVLRAHRHITRDDDANLRWVPCAADSQGAAVVDSGRNTGPCGGASVLDPHRQSNQRIAGAPQGQQIRQTLRLESDAGLQNGRNDSSSKIDRIPRRFRNWPALERSRRDPQRGEGGVIKPVQADPDHNPFDRYGRRTFVALSALSALTTLSRTGRSAHFNQNAADFPTVDP